MSVVLARIAGWAIERPGPVIAATVLVFLLATVAALGLPPEAGTASLVERGSETYAASEDFKREFGDDPVVVLISGDLDRLLTGDDVGALLLLEGCLAGNVSAGDEQMLAASAAAAGIVIPAGPIPAACAELAELEPAQVVYGPATFLDQSARRIQELLGAEAEQTLERSREAYLSAARGARRDGLGEREQRRAGRAAAEQVLVALERRLGGLAADHGLTGFPSLADPRFVRAVVFADPAAGEPKARFSSLFAGPNAALISIRLRPELGDAERREAIELIRAALAEPAFELAGVEYVVSGVPVVAQGLAEVIAGEVLVLGVVVLAIMTLTLGLVLAPPLRLLPLAIAIVATALTFGLLSAFGGSLTMASVAVLPVLIGLAVDYSIQLQARFGEAVRAGARPPRAAVEAAASGGPAIGVAALATAAAVAALALSPIPQVRGFGVLLAIGIALAYCLALTVGLATLSLVRSAGAGPGPAARARARAAAMAPEPLRGPLARAGSATGAAGRHGRARAAGLGRRILAASIARPALTLAIATLLSIGGWYAGTRTEVISDLRELVPRQLPALRDVDELQDATGISGEVAVRVGAPDIADPGVVGWMIDVERRVLERAGYAGDGASCLEQEAPLCPSLSLPDLFGATGGRPGRERIERVLDLLPPYFSQAVVNRGEGDAGDAAAIAFGIKVMPFDEQKRLVDAIRDEVGTAGEEGGPPPGVSAAVVGLPVLAADANAALQGSHYMLAAAGLLAVAAVLLAAYRSPRRILAPLAPIVLATGWTALVLWLTGVPLNPMSATLGALVIAITTEFSVILSARYEEERGRGASPTAALRLSYSRTGTAIAASAITGIAGFAALIATDIRMLRDFGLVTVIDLAVVLAGVLIVLPAALTVAERRFGPAGREGSR